MDEHNTREKTEQREPENGRASRIAKGVVVSVCRFVVALTFLFSGFVKAVDPLGTQYKMADYLAATGLPGLLPDGLLLALSVALSATEFCLGLFLLFAIHRRLVSRLILLFMCAMTPVTLWLAIANPVKDCGCFGDAVVLTNWQTFGKNVVLLVMAAVLAWRPLRMVRFISKTNQWIVINYSVVFIVVTSLYSLWKLPLFDFRPYHIGASIREGMEIPEGAAQPQFDTTFILEKDGERREFTLEDYPDSTWTFIDSKTTQTAEGYVPPIHDFSIQLMDSGEDITDRVVNDKGYTFLLVSPHLEQASDSNFGDIDQLYEYAAAHNYPFYGLTASNAEAVDKWRELTGAEYAFANTDETTLKTIIRSNPGVLLIKDGRVIRKWSHNDLPLTEAARHTAPLEQTEWGQMPDDSTARKTGIILLWFVLPLSLLTLADRTWAWTKWLKSKREKRKNQLHSISNHLKKVKEQ